MSRSYMKTPISSHTCNFSEKYAKQKEHRRWRMSVRTAIAWERWEAVARDRRDSNYTWNKDGKSWFGPPFVLHQGRYYGPTWHERWADYRKWLRK